MAAPPSPPRRPAVAIHTPVEVVRAERFRLLEQVQEAQARSEQAQFVAPGVLGGWIATGVFLADPAHQRILLLLAPLVLALAAVLSTRISPGAGITPSARWTALAFVAGVGASLLRALDRAAWYAPAVSREAALAIAAGGLVLTMLAVYRLSRRGPELALVIIAMITAHEVIRDRIDPDLWFWGTLGVFLLALGAFRLARRQVYRWRLAALQRELGQGQG
jgi:hypothetical protein